MEQPLGFVAWGNSIMQNNEKAIHRLKKSQDHGLKMIWKIDMQSCKTNQLIFFQNTSSGSVIPVVYVDDILRTSSDQ